MKVIFLTARSRQNIALSNMLNESFELVGIAYETRYSKNDRIKTFLKKINYNPFQLIKKLYQKYSLKAVDNAVSEYIDKAYDNYLDFPENVALCEVENINDPKTVELLKTREHDLIVVSGTRMVRRKILNLKPKFGIINLHTGLSPYYNGGPSCTFWCLHDEEIEYIGSTVMFIDAGIDSGNIILSDTVEVDNSDTHASLEFKAIDLGNKLVVDAIKYIASNPEYKGIEQKSIGQGKIFYNRDFTFEKRKNLENRINNGLIPRLVNLQKDTKIVKVKGATTLSNLNS